jgi:hypothetical protein
VTSQPATTTDQADGDPSTFIKLVSRDNTGD